MTGFVRTFDGHANIIGLLLREFGQLHTEFFKVKPRNLLIEVFGQGVNANFALLCPQIHLRQHLIGKRIGHHKRRMPGRTAEIDQTAFREQKDRTPIWKRVFIDLRLDIFVCNARVIAQLIDLNFIVKMPDIAHNSLVEHIFHVLNADNIRIARRRHKNIGFGKRIFHSRHFKPLHCRLQSAYRIDFRHQHARAKTPHRLGTSLAHIAITAHANDFSGDHNICRALNTIGERLAAAIEIIEFRFGHRIIDIDRGKEKRTLIPHLIQAMNTRCRLL